jgi:hypothetical protein
MCTGSPAGGIGIPGAGVTGPNGVVVLNAADVPNSPGRSGGAGGPAERPAGERGDSTPDGRAGDRSPGGGPEDGGAADGPAEGPDDAGRPAAGLPGTGRGGLDEGEPIMSAGSGGTGAAVRSAPDLGGSCAHRPADVRPSTLTSSGEPGSRAATSASRSQAGTAAAPRPDLNFSPDSGESTGFDPFWDLIVSLEPRAASAASVAGGTASAAARSVAAAACFGSLSDRAESPPRRTASLSGRAVSGRAVSPAGRTVVSCSSTLAVTLPDALPSSAAATARAAAVWRALTNRPLAPRAGRFLTAGPAAALSPPAREPFPDAEPREAPLLLTAPAGPESSSGRLPVPGVWSPFPGEVTSQSPSAPRTRSVADPRNQSVSAA